MRALWIPLFLLVGCGGQVATSTNDTVAVDAIGNYSGTARLLSTTETKVAQFQIGATSGMISTGFGTATFQNSTGEGTLTINGLTEPCTVSLHRVNGLTYGTIYRERFTSDWTRVRSAWVTLSAGT